MTRLTIPVLILSGVLALAFAYLAYTYYKTTQLLTETKNTLASTSAAYASTSQELANTKQDNITLSSTLVAEQAKNGTFEAQIAKISGTVGTLTKLSETDPELLQKYSRVYFLNDNYVPSSLSDIDTQYLYQKDRPLQIHTSVLPFLTSMINDASSTGMHIQIISAYRSFGTQAALKSSYKITYGSGSNAFSADQGYSEHQLGTTLDFTTPTVGASFVGFEKSKEYAWLTENAWKYGFILSYPSGNTYYTYEPWHWRFVGLDLARYLHNENMHFYDLDQRNIDPYLVSIFDQK